jgi:putative spermidine/putrescine transport system substrate-binding protein
MTGCGLPLRAQAVSVPIGDTPIPATGTAADMILRSAAFVTVAVLCLASHSTAGHASALTLALPTGPLLPALTAAFAQPFQQATGTEVRVAATDGSIDAARAAHADIMVADPTILQAGCKAGTLQKLDWNALGGRDREVAGSASDCGEGAVLRSIVLAWNRDKFPGPPTWSEFWDVAKVPGKRGLRHSARTNLEIALLADGVAPSDVYSTLRGPAGVDRAFRKLDQLKPYLVWWSAPDEAARLLESSEVLMTSAPADGVIAARRGQGGAPNPILAVQWSGSLTFVESWAILAGAQPLATKFVAFAADPKIQHRLAALGAYGGATTGATDGLPADQLAISPSTPANLADGLMVDEQFWRENGPKLEQQFEAWLAK